MQPWQTNHGYLRTLLADTMKRILVAGGAGFLGSNLCAELLDRGDSVFCLDNLSTGSLRNIAPLFDNERFHFIPDDVIHPQNLTVSMIYNFASPAAPGDYKRDPEGTMEANTEGTETLLKLAEKTGAKFLQASTIRVNEQVASDSPHAAYIEGKRKAEALCMKYHNSGKVEVKIARLNNTYGPKMSFTDSRVVPQFVLKAITDEPLVIWGGGEQRDSFCYVDDMVEGLIRYMESDISPGPIEFGDTECVSIKELAEMTVWTLGSKSKIILNGHGGPGADRTPDISRARNWLGWQPLVSLEHGLNELADYYREAMRA